MKEEKCRDRRKWIPRMIGFDGGKKKEELDRQTDRRGKGKPFIVFSAFVLSSWTSGHSAKLGKK